MATDVIKTLGEKAKQAKLVLAAASAAQKNEALLAAAKELRAHKAEILAENEKDLQAARKNGMRPAMLDRLSLDEKRIEAMADACVHVAALDDPVGEVIGGGTRPNGMQIRKIRVPMGVIGIIYEARPNVTVDAAILCIKSGNAVILRGGSEALCSNRCLTKLLRRAAASAGLPEDVVALIEQTDHETAAQLMRANEYVDVLIPRGGAGLIRAVVQQAAVPVIETGVGNCHLYVDSPADPDMASNILINGKTQRPSVCNALETCLVHADMAETFLPLLGKEMTARGVELRGCAKTRAILGDAVIPATEEDYATEFNDLILAVRVVDDLDAAIAHIQTYSTGHSECIVTKSYENAQRFQREIDAAAVYVNCSTRFTDGDEFGLGAEIGISTQKLHARGPMGLRELTTMKYLIDGSGQVR